MRVAILDMQTGAITGVGECDGKYYDGMYVKVFRDGVSDKSAAMTLTFAGAVFPEGEVAKAVSAKLMALHAERKAADDRYYKAMYEAVNQYKAFGGTKL